MNCPICSGTGQVRVATSRRRGPIYEACSNCHGYGVVHCCEGDRAEPVPLSDTYVTILKSRWLRHTLIEVAARAAVEAIERESTTAPVLEALKAALALTGG